MPFRFVRDWANRPPMTDARINLHADFASVIDTALTALETAGTLPAGLNRGAVTCEPPNTTGTPGHR